MKWYIWIVASLFVFLFSSSAHAAGPLDYFEVILGADEAKVWEALDITISAVDKNWEIVTDYTGDILVFSESDAEAEFPNALAENSYSFTNINEWSVKFENAVKFNNAGVQDVYVYDLNDENILWVAEVTISEDEIESNVEIQIISPENGVTLGKNNITVSGMTKKNHQVRIIVNNDQDLFTTSNAEWLFEKEVENLTEWTNSIQAHVLNADSEKIGESWMIDIKINSAAPEFKRINITPEGEVEAESEITVEVISNAGLSEVRVIINDIITTLSEWKDGIYTGTTLAPAESGEYWVDVVLKDEFANESTNKDAATIMVKDKIPDLTAWDDEPEEKIIEPIEGVMDDSLDLEIKDIEVTELKTKSVITWSGWSDAESYNIYKKMDDWTVELLENVSDTRYEIAITWDVIRYEDFAIKAVWKTASWELAQWDLSEMTKVKTWPELYFLFALIAILLTWGIFFMRREA